MSEREPVPVETLIGWVLRAGVVISVTVIVIGLALTFIHHPEYVSSKDALRQLIDPERRQLDSRAGVWGGMLQLRGQAIVMLGLLLLIATPVMRVAASIFIFARERDRLYIAITTLVLLLLLTSFFLGAHA